MSNTTSRISISVEDALAAILERVTPLEGELAPLDAALGRVLAEDVVAGCTLPPFANSGMDGFAVRVADIAAASREAPARLRVAHSIAAGFASEQPVTPGTAVRIMTGAPLPPGAEAVVPLEETRDPGDGTVLVMAALPAGRHIRPAGEDIRTGDLAIAAGQRLRPQEIGLLAALGITEVPVVRRPRVAILSTGDELLAPGQPLAPGKIRDANGPALAALARSHGATPIGLGIARDTLEALRERLQAALGQRADLIITSAGASGGDYDLIKGLLESEGQLVFWLVDMKPGRPLTFGHFGDVPLVGLPGNPAAALIAADLFVRPAILRMAGYKQLARPGVRAILDERIRKGLRRHYVRGGIRREGNAYHAIVSRGSHGAGSLTGLVQANALLVIPPGEGALLPGAEVEAIVLDDLLP